MTWLKTPFKQGVFGTGWLNGLICIALVVGVYVASKIYGILNHGPNVIFLRSPIDDLIPLFPPLVVPYVSLEPFIYASLILFLVFRTRIFQSAALSMLTAWAISFVFYIFLQSYMDRPVLAGNDMFIQMLREVYAGDNAYNCFPSLHTSLSTVLAIHWWRTDKRIGVPVAIWVTLIVLSTMFVKQHYIADVIGGLAIAFGGSWFFLKQVASRR
jgi:membrane-associated phospholipid phosphatase